MRCDQGDGHRPGRDRRDRVRPVPAPVAGRLRGDVGGRRRRGAPGGFRAAVDPCRVRARRRDRRPARDGGLRRHAARRLVLGPHGRPDRPAARLRPHRRRVRGLRAGRGVRPEPGLVDAVPVPRGRRSGCSGWRRADAHWRTRSSPSRSPAVDRGLPTRPSEGHPLRRNAGWAPTRCVKFSAE